MLAHPIRNRTLLSLLVGFLVVLAQPVSAQVCSVDEPPVVKKNKVFKKFTRGPVKSLLYPATVVKVQGRAFLVERAGSALSEHKLLHQGSELNLNDVVQTADQSFISIRLKDGTVSMLPSNSRVQFSKASSSVARYILQQGELDNKVIKKPKAGSNTFEIQTPSSMIGVRGTAFNVRQPQSNAPTIAQVEHGTVWARSLTTCRAPLVIEAGMGAVLNGSPAVPLLAAPALVNPDVAQPDADLLFKMQPLKGAVRYKAQVLGDVSVLETYAEAYSDSPEVRISGQNIPNGYYYVKLTGFDAAGLQSMSQSYLFLRVRNDR